MLKKTGQHLFLCSNENPILFLKTVLCYIPVLLFLLLIVGCGRSTETTINGKMATSESSISDKQADEKSSTGNSNTNSGTLPTPLAENAADSEGLTSIEAPELVWPKAMGNFKDAVLWRMAPINDKKSTQLKLDENWQENDRSTAWFIWYADPYGENWLMFTVEGKKQTKTDIGTRSFSALNGVPADWPHEHPNISMKQAAANAVGKGADLNTLTWVELNCDYESADYGRGPVWAFTCSETTASGGSLNYTIFVDAISGEVAGAINDRNEAMTLPIDRNALGKTRDVDHQKDLELFFSFIEAGDPIESVRQLSSSMAPDEASAQQWLDNFQSLQSLKIISIEPVRLEEWTKEWETYKVTLEITTNEPPEKYGWENGTNIRWITLVPQGSGGWKINSFAMSP